MGVTRRMQTRQARAGIGAGLSKWEIDCLWLAGLS